MIVKKYHFYANTRNTAKMPRSPAISAIQAFLKNGPWITLLLALTQDSVFNWQKSQEHKGYEARAMRCHVYSVEILQFFKSGVDNIFVGWI